jgi:hypothetical protein
LNFRGGMRCGVGAIAIAPLRCSTTKGWDVDLDVRGVGWRPGKPILQLSVSALC